MKELITARNALSVISVVINDANELLDIWIDYNDTLATGLKEINTSQVDMRLYRQPLITTNGKYAG